MNENITHVVAALARLHGVPTDRQSLDRFRQCLASVLRQRITDEKISERRPNGDEVFAYFNDAAHVCSHEKTERKR